jgi:thiol-disulfide isomerase/thioredoxin
MLKKIAAVSIYVERFIGRVLVFEMALFLFFGCMGNNSDKDNGSDKVVNLFTPPKIPSLFATEKEQREYYVSHYWDGLDFKDTSAIQSNAFEKIFLDFIYILPDLPLATAEGAIKEMMSSAECSVPTFLKFFQLAEKYLYEPNSPYRCEEFYIPVLEAVVSSKVLDSSFKLRPQHQLEMAMKNRPGSVAADFQFYLKDGRELALSQVKGRFIVLFFNNPECNDCQRVKEFIQGSSILNGTGVRVLSIYPDRDVESWFKMKYPDNWINGYNGELSSSQIYDLKAIPTLYLLDDERHILLKDAPIEVIENRLTM